MAVVAAVGVDGDCKFIRDLCRTGGEAQHPANSCCSLRKAQQSYPWTHNTINAKQVRVLTRWESTYWQIIALCWEIGLEICFSWDSGVKNAERNYTFLRNGSLWGQSSTRIGFCIRGNCCCGTQGCCCDFTAVISRNKASACQKQQIRIAMDGNELYISMLWSQFLWGCHSNAWNRAA